VGAAAAVRIRRAAVSETRIVAAYRMPSSSSLPPHAATASAPAHAASHARPVRVAFMVLSLR
jgi:hypothetical protein